jgi:hypothetical protein
VNKRASSSFADTDAVGTTPVEIMVVCHYSLENDGAQPLLVNELQHSWPLFSSKFELDP